jgi:hypothetical protein
MCRFQTEPDGFPKKQIHKNNPALTGYLSPDGRHISPDGRRISLDGRDIMSGADL